MQPVLALELSTDGILLHELSYDGVWRRLAAASLNDPFLPKKMETMRRMAQDSQGRFFKNQVWLPPEQIYGLEAKLTATNAREKQSEAEAIIRNDPAFANEDYVVKFGEEDAYGNTRIVAVNRGVLLEASRFVTEYGFTGDEFTSRDRVYGFYHQPYFRLTSPPPVSIDFRKVGYFASVATLLVALSAGGYWAYQNIEFIPDPSIAIEATDARILQLDEDPRAPIRPTKIAVNKVPLTVEVIAVETSPSPLPEHDIATTNFETLISQLALGSELGIALTPETSASLSMVTASALSPLTNIEPADDLPAPETLGFPVVSTKSINFVDTSGPRDIDISPSIFRYETVFPIAGNISSPRQIDVLPLDVSTVVLATQLRKYNDSLGLTQVRNNQAALIQFQRIQELQQVKAVVTSGRPDILPVLRNGGTIPKASPPTTSTDFEAEVMFTTLTGLTVEQLQLIPPRVVNGRPSNQPLLRGGNSISDSIANPGNTDNLTDAQRLHPLTRPESIELTAIIAGLSQEAVPRTYTPFHRGPDFAAKATALADLIAEKARTTPTFTDERRNVNLPTSANVARTATIVNGINLNETSLIGVYGKPGAYKALLRQRGGKYHMLQVGDVIDRWKIVAIDANSVRLQKGGKTKVLELPAEG